MNTTLRRMTLAAALLSASMPASADQRNASVGDLAGLSAAGKTAAEVGYGHGNPTPDANSQMYIGDSFVGDSEHDVSVASEIPATGTGDESLADLLKGNRDSSNAVGDLAGFRSLPSLDGPAIEPLSETDELAVTEEPRPTFSPISHSDLAFPEEAGVYSYAPPIHQARSMTTSCDGGCDGGCTGCCGTIGSAVKRRGNGWMRAELLLWFPEQRQVPPLVSTAPTGGLPQLDRDGAEVAFGGGVGGDLSPGFRIDGGRYLTDRFGVGGRFWILSQDSENLFLEGDGTGGSIGRPFFNTDLPGPDAILVNLAGNFAGSIAVESELEMLAAEAYGKLRIGDSRRHQLSLIGGYTHFSIDDRLWASSTSINTGTGTASSFFDEFDAENDFHGGQLGLETILNKGCWTLSSLTKVHFGNMNQVINIDGSSSVVTTAPTVSNFDAGALALDAQGEFERDEFTFAPEVNLNLAYRFRPNVLLSVGYSFIYFDNVLLAGNHVDPVFSGSSILTDGPYGQRDFDFNEGSLWVQGIDLGFILDF